MRLVFGRMFVAACFFPWLSFNILSFETQPWPLIWGLIFLFFVFLKEGIRNIEFFILIAPLFVLVVGMFFGVDSLLVRGFVSYFSFSVIFVATYRFLKNYGFPLNLIFYINLVWLIVGAAQIFLGNGLTDFLLVSRTSEARGVTGLAPEPTFYAIFLFCISWIILAANKYEFSGKYGKLIVVNLLFIVFVAKSSLGLILIFIAFSFASLFFLRRNFSLLIFSLLIVVPIFYFLVGQFMEESRIYEIFKVIFSNPMDVVVLDASANERVKNIFYPFLGFFDNRFLPGGFSSFWDMHDKISVNWGEVFWYGDGGDKILSLIGSVVYEMGFLGVCLIISVFWLARGRGWKSFFELALMFFLCLSAVSLAFPLIAMIMALFYYRRINGYV